MTAFTDFAENKIIDWLFRGQAIGITGASAAAGTGPTNLYIGLFTTMPTSDGVGAGVEPSGNGYARYTVASNTTNWAATQNTNPTGTTAGSSGATGTTFNATAITFPAPTPGAWGLILGFGVFDALTGGNLLIYGTLTTQKTINGGDSAPSFAAGALTFQIDN